MKRLHGQHVFVDSVGTRAEEIDPFTIAVMREIGLDLSRHRAKTFEELEDTSYDLVVSLSPEAHHRAVELTRAKSVELEYWSTLDPGSVWGSRDQLMEAYRSVRDALARRIGDRFPPGDRG